MLTVYLNCVKEREREEERKKERERERKEGWGGREGGFIVQRMNHSRYMTL